MSRTGNLARFAAVTALSLSGCGTMMNVHPQDSCFGQGPGEVYGGVKYDAHAGAAWFADAGESGDAGNFAFDASIGALLWAVDLPLSAVGDTLTLPVTVRAALQKKDEGQGVPAAPARLPAPDSVSLPAPPSGGARNFAQGP